MTLTLTVFVGTEYFLPKTFLCDYKLLGWTVFNPYENAIFLKTLIINPMDSDQICRFGWRKKTQKSPNILPCNFTLKINSLENIA